MGGLIAHLQKENTSSTQKTMAKFFLDEEFIENGQTIDLIDVGIVSDDNREYYAINANCNFRAANDWVRENVLAPMGITVNGQGRYAVLNLPPNFYEIAKPKNVIAKEVFNFVNPNTQIERPEFWGEWCSYDWVAFCQLWGEMMDLPSGFPMRCRDVIQWAEDHLNIPYTDLPPSLEVDGNHNGLLGARTVKLRWEHCNKIQQERDSRMKEIINSAVILSGGAEREPYYETEWARLDEALEIFR